MTRIRRDPGVELTGDIRVVKTRQKSHNEAVEKGFNSNVSIEGQNFHVQTEDWGLQNPFVVSRVYQSGAVLKSVKTSYAEIFSSGPASSTQAIRTALREQHQRILDQLLSGQLF